MAKDICEFIGTGRLTRDAELKYLNSGTAVSNLSLAYTRNIKKGDSWEDKSCYLECTLWGETAENLNQYLTKGQQVAVQGELDFEMWEQDGKKRSKHKLIVQKIKLLGGKKEGSYSPQETATGSNFEDDIPF